MERVNSWVQWRRQEVVAPGGGRGGGLQIRVHSALCQPQIVAPVPGVNSASSPPPHSHCSHDICTDLRWQNETHPTKMKSGIVTVSSTLSTGAATIQWRHPIRRVASYSNMYLFITDVISNIICAVSRQYNKSRPLLCTNSRCRSLHGIKSLHVFRKHQENHTVETSAQHKQHMKVSIYYNSSLVQVAADGV